MTRIVIRRSIDAPVERVFQTVADIRNYANAVPHIVKFEYLSEQKAGLGTRFRETRVMKGKEAATELEITEFVDNERVRMVADSHGTVWDTLFTVKSSGGRVELELAMDAKAYQLLPKLMNPLIKGMVQKAIERDLDAVKAYCEK